MSSSNLATALSAAVNKSLTKNLPLAVSTKFNLDSEAFTSFLGEFLKGQLAASSKKRSKPEKHTSRVSGYNLFFKHLHGVDKSIDFKKAGEQWKALTDAQRADWNDKAAASNAVSRAAAVSPAVVAEPAPVQSVPAAQVAVITRSIDDEPPELENQPAKKKPKKEVEGKKEKTVDNSPKVSQNKETKKWMVSGTSMFVASPKNKVIIGAMRNGVESPLNDEERQMCQKYGWKVQE